MLGFLAAPQQHQRASESQSCHGDVSGSGRHRRIPAASVRVDDHASGDAPGVIFVSVIELPAGEVRYRYLAWSAYLDAVGGDLRN